MICGIPGLSRLKAARSPIILLSLIAGLLLIGCAGPALSSGEGAASTKPSPAPSRTSTGIPTAISTTPPNSVVVQTQPTTFSPSPPARPTSTLRPVAINVPTPDQTGNDTACFCDEPCSCIIEHIVIISIDGLRPDALEQADTPTLDALRAVGAYSPSAQTVLPSVTLVGHASMLGGMSPEQHGIYWNVNDPTLGKINGPTLFSVAREAGLSTVMIVGKPKLEHLVLPGSVDNFTYAGFTDSQVIDRALEVIQAGLPGILFLHLPDVDSAGHATGWMSTEQLITINRTDSQLAKIVAALEADQYLSRTLLMVTSDHGGEGTSHGTNSPEDMTIPWLAVGPGVPSGLILKSQIITYDTAATALYAFRLPIPEMWDGRPVLEIFGKTSVTGE